MHLHDTGCGGLLPISYLRIDLDQDGPVATPRSTPAVSGDPPFPWTVAEHDPASYSIQLGLSAGRVRFVLVLDWTWGDQRRQTTIDDGGKPFAVSTTRQTTVVMCPGAGDDWKRCPS